MNETTDNLRVEIERDLTLLDGFDHGDVSDATMARIHRAMRQELTRSRRRRWMTHWIAPLAAAAAIALTLVFARTALWTGSATSNVQLASAASMNELAAILVEASVADEDEQTSNVSTTTTSTSVAGKTASASNGSTTVTQTEAENLDAVIDDVTVQAFACDLVL